MKHTIVLTLLAASAATLVACGSGDDSGSLLGGSQPQSQLSEDPTSLAAEGNTQHHFQDPNTGENGITDPNEVRAEDQQVGSPEVVARLHACAKIPYATLGSILQTRGVSIQAQNGKQTAGSLYVGGAPALGIANYSGRVPESIVASTSSMTKMFDIFVAAAPEIQKNLTNSTACPGVTIVDQNNKFSKDGISCILGKPATDAHVTLANQIVSQASDPATGVQLAISAMLEAAHTCE